MKSIEQIKSKMFATLAELEYGVTDEILKKRLLTQLEILCDILDYEDVPNEYWDRIEQLIYDED